MSMSAECKRWLTEVKLISGKLSISSFMFLAGYGLMAYVGTVSLIWPFGDDQSHYSLVGDAVTDGGVPYRDAWDLKGPLTYYVYGWTRAIFGRSDQSIRIF